MTKAYIENNCIVIFPLFLPEVGIEGLLWQFGHFDAPMNVSPNPKSIGNYFTCPSENEPNEVVWKQEVPNFLPTFNRANQISSQAVESVDTWLVSLLCCNALQCVKLCPRAVRSKRKPQAKFSVLLGNEEKLCASVIGPAVFWLCVNMSDWSFLRWTVQVSDLNPGQNSCLF